MGSNVTKSRYYNATLSRWRSEVVTFADRQGSSAGQLRWGLSQGLGPGFPKNTPPVAVSIKFPEEKRKGGDAFGLQAAPRSRKGKFRDPDRDVVAAPKSTPPAPVDVVDSRVVLACASDSLTLLRLTPGRFEELGLACDVLVPAKLGVLLRCSRTRF